MSEESYEIFTMLGAAIGGLLLMGWWQPVLVLALFGVPIGLLAYCHNRRLP